MAYQVAGKAFARLSSVVGGGGDIIVVEILVDGLLFA